MSNKNISSAARSPRKRKKQVKKIVAAHTALKVTTAAMATAMGMAQISMIAATPTHLPGPLSIADKALSVARVAMDRAQAIAKIMSEPPNSWKEFIQPKTAFASL